MMRGTYAVFLVRSCLHLEDDGGTLKVSWSCDPVRHIWGRVNVYKCFRDTFATA